MMDNECAFCGSGFWDNRRLCYGCRVLLPALAATGMNEAEAVVADPNQKRVETLRARLKAVSNQDKDEKPGSGG